MKLQKRTDIKLQKNGNASLELDNFVLNARLDRYEREKQLQLEQHSQEIKLLKEKRDEEIEHLKRINDEKFRFYKQMKDKLGVDIAEIIRAEGENAANTKVIRIDGNTGNANFHHHVDGDNGDSPKVVAKALNKK